MSRLGSPRAVLLVVTILVAILAYLQAPQSIRALVSPDKLRKLSIFSRHMGSASSSNMAPKAPIYFVSHGGPTVQYDTKHPVFPVLQGIGREITEKVKPTAVVVFSAHWQADRNAIALNNAVDTDLIYDFYGFPKKFYEATYPSKGSPELASKIIGLLSDAGIKASGVKRGLDHGVWSGFNVAFDPKTNPLNVPLVQVSLYDNEDPDAHFRLGQAVSALRSEGVVIVGAGMSVHNLRSMRSGGAPGSPPLPWAVSFDNALKDAVLAGPVADRQARMAALLRRPDARDAHPTFDHLLPVHVTAGAAGEDRAELIWTMQEGGFGWAQYRFGDVPA